MTENQSQVRSQPSFTSEGKKGPQPSVLTLEQLKRLGVCPPAEILTVHRQHPLPGLLQSILSMRQAKAHPTFLCLVCKIPVFMVHLDKARFFSDRERGHRNSERPCLLQGDFSPQWPGSNPETARVSFFRALKIPSPAHCSAQAHCTSCLLTSLQGPHMASTAPAQANGRPTLN